MYKNWVSDEEAINCPLCQQKFSQLRRKHHCRQCGQVFCSKCCKVNVPLPQLGLENPERVCDGCLPVVELVTKSWSQQTSFQLESIQGLLELLHEPTGMRKVIQLGGLQTIISLARSNSVEVCKGSAEALHLLSMHEPLHMILMESGIVKALCGMLNSASEADEQLLSYLIGSLMIFAKAPQLQIRVVQDGALPPVLALCGMSVSEAIALIAVRTLNLLMENIGSHTALIESDRNALPRLLALTLSDDEQMQEVSLKTLARLSMGSDWHRHRIVQEDFSAGKCLMRSLQRQPKNMQVLCNAACLVANLATSEQDQSKTVRKGARKKDIFLTLAQTMVGGDVTSETHYFSGSLKLHFLIAPKASVVQHNAPLSHVVRGLANFSSFHQNVYRLEQHLSKVISVGLKSDNQSINQHSMRFILHVLHRSPQKAVSDLLGNGGDDFLLSISKTAGMVDAMQGNLKQYVKELCPPS
ncbi:putative ARM REPEAT PROTEIN INTERACTING WITH ABF2 [Apostichopus japonicus]|uniref:Putative ARM REPEAT PROTEIN INTERACTING WITH ABF2 n=1 Tax=Stichopus japonicus TaxID=307972 RepID=A0A2G8LJJ6_STIJA|nr:putative ARM REPEAT PROTEIN INTERACTING WITH ABF2 [Apostichopus japonicus]